MKRELINATLLLLGSLVRAVFTFTTNIGSNHVRMKTSPRTAAAASSSSNDKEEGGLTLIADARIISGTLPCSDPLKVKEFLMRDETRNLIMSAGGERPYETINRTPQLLQLWENVCEEYFTDDDKPKESDELFAVDTSIKFPGLTLVTSSLNGIKKITSSGDDKESLVYEFYLIGEEQTLKGAPPMVWLYKQLSNKDEEKSGYGPTNGKVKTSVTLVKQEDGYALDLDCRFQILMKFPRIALKLLPASKEKIEAQASESIRKTVETDLKKSLQAVEKTFSESLAHVDT